MRGQAQSLVSSRRAAGYLVPRVGGGPSQKACLAGAGRACLVR